MFKKIIFTISLLAFFTSCKTSIESKSQIVNILEEETDSLLSRSTLNAISVGVIHNGEIYKLHKGELTKGKRNEPTNETLYEIAATSKAHAEGYF